MNAKLPSTLLSLLVFSFFFGCKNDDVETPLQEFELSITQDGNKLYHSWAEVNISDFERYILVRSSEPIPVTLDPFSSTSFNSEISLVVHEESDKTISEWEELALSEKSKLFYRVFIKLSDRYIVSNEKEVSFDEKIISHSTLFFDAEVFHHPELKLIYIIDYDSLFAYNYQSNELVAAAKLLIEFDNGSFSYGKFNGKDEIYLSLGFPMNDRFIILDAISLNQIEIIGDGIGSIEAINTDREGLIIIVDDSSSPIKILNRADGNIIGSAVCDCSAYSRKIDFVSISENILRLSSSELIGMGGLARFTDFTFSDTWEYISETPIVQFQSNLLPKVAFSKSKNYFIPNYNGTIYDSGGNIINSIYDPLDNKGVGYDFVFLENETVLMNLANPSFTNNLTIRTINKYSLPNIELIDSWKLENIAGFVDNYKLFYDEETLLLSYEIFISGGERKVVIQSLNL